MNGHPTKLHFLVADVGATVPARYEVSLDRSQVNRVWPAAVSVSVCRK